MQGEFWICKTREQLEGFITAARLEYESSRFLICQIDTSKPRSPAQNAALHVYCEQLAQALNDSGWDMKLLMAELSKNAEIPWTMLSVKERIWKPVQKQMTDKDSTTNPNRKEYTEIYEAVNRVIANTTGVHVAWPSRFNE